jgi:hypothetical protein
MKVMAFGSCMSNLTINRLVADYGFTQTHSVHHNRSDNFIRYFIDRESEMIPHDFFDGLLSYKSDTENQARMFLRNQYADWIGFHEIEKKSANQNLFADLSTETIDVILMDNYMDISSKLMKCVSDVDLADRPLFINPGFYTNQEEVNSLFDWSGDFLTPEESAKNNVTIYRWLREQQPRAKIFYLTYHSCSSTDYPERFSRARYFYPALVKAAEGEDLNIVPPLEVPPELTKGQIDWPHFQPQVYRALAGYVYLTTVSDRGGWANLHSRLSGVSA